MRRPGPSLTAAIFAATVLLGIDAVRAAPPTTPPLVVRALAEPPRSVAMSDSGLVAMIGAGEQVLIYDKIAPAGAIAPPRKVGVGAQPRSVTYKKVGTQELLIVCCAGDRSIWLLDGKNGKLIRKIAAPGGVPAGIVAPESPDCPFAYVALDPPVGTLARLDLKAYKIGDFLQSTLGNFGGGAASPDGKVVYVTGLNENVANQLVPWLVPETGTAITRQLQRAVLPTGMMQVDAKGRFGVAGSVVTDLLMSRQSATLKGLNLLILPDQPVSIALDEGELVAYSTNTWTELKRMALPADFIPPLTKETLDHEELVMFKMQEGRLTMQALANQRIKTRAERGQPPVWTFYDRATKSLVLINESKLLSVPLASLSLPKEPDLNFAIDAPSRVPVGKPWKATIKGEPKAELSVVEGPADAKVEGQAVTLLAKSADIGPATLTVRSQLGEIYHDESVQLTISRPSVEVGVPSVDRFSVSPDGSKLLVRGMAFDPQREGQPIGWRFTLIDLNTFAQIAQRDVKAEIHRDSMALGNDLAVMALTDSDALLALSAKDLSDAGRRFIKGRAGRLLIRGDELYAAADAPNGGFGDSGGNLVRYKLPSFEEDGRHEPYVFATPGENNDPERARVPYRVREGTYFAGTVYEDEALKKPKMLVTAVGFLAGTNVQIPFLPNRWGVELRPDGLVRNGGQLLRKIADVRWPGYVIHPDVPLLLFGAGATGQGVPGDRRVVQKFELMAHELSDGDLAGSTVIAQEFNDDNGIPTMPMTMTPKGVVVAIRGRVYLVEDADVKAIPTRSPLLVYPKAPQIVLSGAGPFLLEHVAENAEGATKWSLRDADPALSIDARTGTVTLDASKLAAAVPQRLHDWATAWRSHGMIDGSTWETRRTAAPPPPILVDDYVKAASDRADLLFGKPVNDVPMAIPIYVEAVDGRGRSNVTYYTVLLELPRAEVMKNFK